MANAVNNDNEGFEAVEESGPESVSSEAGTPYEQRNRLSVTNLARALFTDVNEARYAISSLSGITISPGVNIQDNTAQFAPVVVEGRESDVPTFDLQAALDFYIRNRAKFEGVSQLLIPIAQTTRLTSLNGPNHHFITLQIQLEEGRFKSARTIDSKGGLFGGILTRESQIEAILQAAALQLQKGSGVPSSSQPFEYQGRTYLGVQSVFNDTDCGYHTYKVCKALQNNSSISDEALAAQAKFSNQDYNDIYPKILRQNVTVSGSFSPTPQTYKSFVDEHKGKLIAAGVAVLCIGLIALTFALPMIGIPALITTAAVAIGLNTAAFLGICAGIFSAIGIAAVVSGTLLDRKATQQRYQPKPPEIENAEQADSTKAKNNAPSKTFSTPSNGGPKKRTVVTQYSVQKGIDKDEDEQETSHVPFSLK